MLISHKISEINQLIASHKTHYIGLTGGLSGVMLYYSNLYQIERKKEHLFAIENLLDTIFGNVASSKDILFSYSSGLAGIGCVVEYVSKNRLKYR